MITATRYHDISVGHRVFKHFGKCAHLHGHNYRITFTFEAVGETGDMVIDFAFIKKFFCKWLDENWDHRFLIFCDDEAAVALRALDEKVLIVPFNPTAENMARYLAEVIVPEISTANAEELASVRLVSLDIEETRKCSAKWSVNK